MSGLFIIWFSTCFVCYALRTAYNVLNHKKHPLAASKKMVASVYAVMFILWLSWFQMCFSDPLELIAPGYVRYTGLLMFVLGVLLFILSHTKLGGFRHRDQLATTGIYSRIRNPMYLGFILWVVGLPIFTGSLMTLLSSAVWISHIIVWKVLEERELANRHTEYGEYVKRTWF
jgi:protein-S-isoprenylcysteine O-methyltransferase Ste14